MSYHEQPVFAYMLQPDPDALPVDGEVHDNSWYNQDFGGFRVSEHILYKKRPIRVIFVGAGASGINFAYKAPRALENCEYVVYEKNKDLGGTWLENRYPGCTCDIPAHSYQFTWARNARWSSFYAKSEEIWQYMKDTAIEHGLEKHIKYDHRVERAKWNEEDGAWELTIRGPDGVFEDRCDVLVNGSGLLNEWRWPDLPGIEKFQGKLIHSANWDYEYDLKGKTVATIGAGSSAVQIIPNIQKGMFQVKKLFTFIRSPTWIITGIGAQYAGPNGTNFQYTEEQKVGFENDPDDFDQYVRGLEGELNKRFTLMHGKSKDQSQAREFAAKNMHDDLNGNANLIDHIVPNFALGCRRMTPAAGFLKALQAPNVEVITQGVTAFTKEGVIDEEGVEHKVDVVVCATGFINAFQPQFECIGRDGVILSEQTGDLPKSYLAVMTRNFPNLFMVIGPNGPSSHGSLLPIIEWHTRYIFKMINKMQRENIKSYEPKEESMTDIFNYTHELFKRLVWSSVCRSWFKNGKVHGPVTAVYAGSRLHYFEIMNEVRYEDYDINYRSNNRFQFMGNGYTETETTVDGNAVWYLDTLRAENPLIAGRSKEVVK